MILRLPIALCAWSRGLHRGPFGACTLTRFVSLTLLLCNVTHAQASEAAIILNEFHVDPLLKYEPVEFIELHNAGSTTVALDGWKLADGVDYTFPLNTTLESGAYLVLAQDPDALQQKFGVNAMGPWTGKLANDGERVELRDAAGVVIDTVDYQLGYPWPTVGDAPETSMQLIQPGLDNDLAGSWRSAEPTPGSVNAVPAGNAPPQTRQVRHEPASPRSGQQVRITVKATDPDGVAAVTLAYQLVNPGHHIRSSDPEFETNWVSLAMSDDGIDGDEVAGDSIFTVMLDGSLQEHRRLVRYRIVATDTSGATITVPYPDDPQLNFAYFCYDAVPDWTGADRPGVTPQRTYSSEVLESLPIYHVISREEDVLESQFKYINCLTPEAAIYKWTGAFVYNGVVYDHIRYRVRGWCGAYGMGKNKWKFKFNRGHELQAHDEYGQPYRTRWNTLNFSATIMNPGNPHRGEHGMFEAATYRLFNLTGVPAPVTHWLHFRVVDNEQETDPEDQYEGDFWGLYMAIEQPDGRFLDQHGLPDGNLYKMAGEYSNPNNQGPTQEPVLPGIAPGSALAEFIATSSQGAASQEWWEENAQLELYYSYRCIVDAVHHYDVPYAWNSIFYHHPETGQWWMLPWDVDNTWDGAIYENDTEQYSQVLRRFPEHRLRFENRAREIRDLLFNAEHGGLMLDELAAAIPAPAGEDGSTIRDADRARWDWSPRLNTGDATVYVDGVIPGGKDYRGLFYQNPKGDFSDMLGYMKEFMTAGWGGNNLEAIAAEPHIPATPSVHYLGAPAFAANFLRFQASAYDPGGAWENGEFAAMKWRIAEVSHPGIPGFRAGTRWKHEMTTVWESDEISTFVDTIQIPPQAVRVGGTYRVRLRMKNGLGIWSHWSPPFEFYAGRPDVADYQTGLRISEILYHPIAGEDGSDAEDYEFLELKNVGATSLDLGGLFFSEGIEFTFANGTILDPGQFFVLGNNKEALQRRYPGLIVNGVYVGRLANSGETITVSASLDAPVLSVTYDDQSPWPLTPDGLGFSLVPLQPGQTTHSESWRDWRASTQQGGSPGADDPAPVMTPGILINEVLSATTAPQVDAIELFNPLAVRVDLGGWFLTDDPVVPAKFQIVPSTFIEAGGFLLFEETTFNSGPDSSGNFALSSTGEEVYLFSANESGELTGYSHGIRFGAAASGVSFGRHITSTGEEQYPAQIVYTPAQINAGPRIGPIVINEIHYHPDMMTDDEFVELKNITEAPVPLFDPVNPTNTWRLSGLGYSFPQNYVMAPGATLLVVPIEPDVFRAKYNVPAGVQIMGPHPGTLRNDGELLELQRPGTPRSGGTPYITVDAVGYDNGTPWPTAADGSGASLQRIVALAYGNDPAHWQAALPTPGTAYVSGAGPRITREPSAQTVVVPGDVTFRVSAEGAAPLNYQWRLDGQAIPGARDSELVLTGTQVDQGGNYSVVVYNSAGSIESRAADLTVLIPPKITAQPQTQYVRAGAQIVFSLSAQSSTRLRYQWRFDGVEVTGATNSSLVIPEANLDVEGRYVAVVTDEVGPVQSSGADLVLLINPQFLEQPQTLTAVEGDDVTFHVNMRGTRPFGYRWRRNGRTFRGFDEGSSSLTLTNVMQADAARYDVIVTNRALLVPGVRSSVARLTVLSDSDRDSVPDEWEEANGLNPNDDSDAIQDKDGDGQLNWEEFRAGTDPSEAEDRFRILAGSSDDNTVTLEFSATSNRVYRVEWKEGIGYGRWSRLLDVSARTTNRIVRIDDPYPPAEGRMYRLVTPRLESPALGPTILRSPQSRLLNVGDSVSLRVDVLETRKLTYQWYHDGNLIPGATTRNLSLPAVQFDNSGLYTVVATDLYGKITNQPPAIVAVRPQILTAPESQTVASGETVTLVVGAAGIEPLSYRWMKDGERLEGATGSSLTLVDVQAADAGLYQVSVSHETPLGVVGTISDEVVLVVE